MNDQPVLLTCRQVLYLTFLYAFDPKEHDPKAPEATELARASADEVFATARRKGASETLVQRVTTAFSRGSGPQCFGAVDALMKVITEGDVVQAMPDVFNHGGVK